MQMAKPDDMASLKDLIREAHKNPLSVTSKCRSASQNLEKGYQKTLRRILAAAYAAACVYAAGHPDWVRFAEDPFWAFWKRKPDPKGNGDGALFFVLLFVFEAKGYDRAWKYARALQPYFDDEVNPDEVADKIRKDGGIEKLCAQAIRASPRRKAMSQALSSSAQAADDQSHSETKRLAEENIEPEQSFPSQVTEILRSRGDLGGAPEHGGADRKTLALDGVFIETNSSDLERILKMRKGDRADIRVKQVGQLSSGWKRIKMIKIDYTERRSAKTRQSDW